MQPVAAPGSVGSASGGGWLGGLGGDLDMFFRPGVPTRDTTTTVAGVLRAIDWAAPVLVLWLPGTNQPGVPDAVREGLRGIDRRLRAVSMPYMASWQLRTSIADGERTFRALLEAVARRRRPGQRVIVLGESQGAWIASNVLADRRYAALVDRTALIAHPGIATNHARGASGGPETLPASIAEFNNPGDVTTRYLESVGDRATEVIDAASNMRIGQALLGALSIVVNNPAALGVLLGSQSFRTSGGASPHAAGSPYHDALKWALAGHATS